ncbi:MAG: selenocysteine-specific translation elongation factor [Desulfatibacillaceae bacterium]
MGNAARTARIAFFNRLITDTFADPAHKARHKRSTEFMKQIILGTAGHIDHGKTSLIRALTGTDTDRLVEEKRRGITIELGFAALELPSGQRVGVVDVPGHEKFVKNMVAGATGIDVVAMIIAADEGVMPQTREHLDICSLLGVRHGMVVVTKVDMVDEDWLELVLDDIAESLEGTFLEGAPVVTCSSVTGQGLDAFREELDAICEKVPAHGTGGVFRLPTDRVFTMRGFGTVITGTVVSGRISVGEPVEIYPTTIRSKVRGLQVHGESVGDAEAGMRTAINFQGVDKAQVERGDVVARPGTLVPSYMVDVLLRLLPTCEKPLKTRKLVRFHTGTSEVLGKVVFLDREELAPGEEAVAQLRLDNPVCTVRDDRFVIRSYSPVDTIGGGVVVNPVPQKHKSGRKKTMDRLNRLARAEAGELVALHVEEAGYAGATRTQLLLMTNLSERKLGEALQALLSAREMVQVGRDEKVYVHKTLMGELENKAEKYLGAYHKANPLKPGMPREELKSKFPPNLDVRVFHQLLETMRQNGVVEAEEDMVRLAGHKASLGVEQAEQEQRIKKAMSGAGLQPPTTKELCGELGVGDRQLAELMAHMVEKGDLVKVKQDLFFDREAVEALKERLVAHLREHGDITTPVFKEMTGASRKFVIPLLEYFDTRKVTLRVGDVRKLREST